MPCAQCSETPTTAPSTGGCSTSKAGASTSSSATAAATPSPSKSATACASTPASPGPRCWPSSSGIPESACCRTSGSRWTGRECRCPTSSQERFQCAARATRWGCERSLVWTWCGTATVSWKWRCPASSRTSCAGCAATTTASSQTTWRGATGVCTPTERSSATRGGSAAGGRARATRPWTRGPCATRTRRPDSGLTECAASSTNTRSCRVAVFCPCTPMLGECAGCCRHVNSVESFPLS